METFFQMQTIFTLNVYRLHGLHTPNLFTVWHGIGIRILSLGLTQSKMTGIEHFAQIKALLENYYGLVFQQN